MEEKWNILECFYRVSIKALVLNGKRDKFLLMFEEKGMWDLPGGGLEWGAVPHEDLGREIMEEMGVEVKQITDNPCYFVSWENKKQKDIWIAAVIYETELKNLDFTPSAECTDVRFVSADEIHSLNFSPSATVFAEKFNPENHKQYKTSRLIARFCTAKNFN